MNVDFTYKLIDLLDVYEAEEKALLDKELEILELLTKIGKHYSDAVETRKKVSLKIDKLKERIGVSLDEYEDQEEE